MSRSEQFIPDLVSIVMPARNAELTIAKSIESVLRQSYTQIELIIVNDKSTDKTVAISECYAEQDSRVKLLHNSSSVGGIYNARNIAIKFAVGQYIAFLDSDDQLLVDSVKNRVHKLKDSKGSVVYGSYFRVRTNGCKYLVVPPSSLTFFDMLKFNYIGNLTGMYDQSLIGKFYQSDMKHEDYLMWCQILVRARSASSVGITPLAHYNISPTSTSSNKLNAFFWRWRVLRVGLKINLLACFYYQIIYSIRSIARRLAERFVIHS